jgi:hypothetical protein
MKRKGCRRMDDTRDLLRKNLKVLLLDLASSSERPSVELQAILHEVINELHDEVKKALRTKNTLRLVPAPSKASLKS